MASAQFCYFWDYVDYFVQKDADCTIEYDKICRYGPQIFPRKRPKRRERENRIWQCMSRYHESGMKDPGRYIQEMASLYTKRIRDNLEILQKIQEYDEEAKLNDVHDMDMKFEPILNAMYVPDSAPLQILRRDDNVFKDNECQDVWDYLKLTREWKFVTDMKPRVPKNKKAGLQPYKGSIQRTLNCIMPIQYGRYYKYSFISFIGGDSAFVFENGKQKTKATYTVIVDFTASVNNGDVYIVPYEARVDSADFNWPISERTF